MALPPRFLGTRAHPTRLQRVDAQRYRVTVGEHPLSPIFGSADEAREAGMAEEKRLDAIALALLRRIRSRSSRKQP